MTKQADLDILAGRDRPALLLGGCPDIGGGHGDLLSQTNESGNDLLPSERGARTEHQTEIGVEMYIVFKCPTFRGGMKWCEGDAQKVIALTCEPQEPGTDQLRVHFGQDKVHDIRPHVCAPTGDEKNPMLVLDIHGVEFVDFVSPARFRLTSFDSEADLFGGQLYKSTAQNVFFVVRPVDGELNVISPRGVRTDDREVGVIENNSEVVYGIPKKQGYPVWDGYICLNRQGQIASFWIEAANELEGSLIEKGADQPIEIVDMLVRAA